MNLKYYIILAIVGVCFISPPDVFGQYLLKETVHTVSYAVIYSDGMSKSAQWDLGFKMMKNGRTIRHQSSKGNGGNISVNDRLPMRFIVAPEDLTQQSTWLQAEGVDGTADNGNLSADFSGGTLADYGCNSYKVSGDGGRIWRLPTQRELQLIWMFRVPVGVIYSGHPMEENKTKLYWSSTEKEKDSSVNGDATNAWFFDFQKDAPKCSWMLKDNQAYVRCVSDY